ncbi:unnamed protein product [Heligmosomoides polygyrus]|uniref:Transposase n=1 Tax=Heligmosomoides polygyrus TaxID=6339 RepID=A0A183FWU6_HELPZ|nr:unnamed protein product [Heligmosomoides polygyrus]
MCQLLVKVAKFGPPVLPLIIEWLERTSASPYARNTVKAGIEKAYVRFGLSENRANLCSWPGVTVDENTNLAYSPGSHVSMNT